MKWLTPKALFTAVLLAGCCWYYLGWRSIVLPMVFLIVGSLLSKLNHIYEEDQPRNTYQVLANGGLILLVCPLALYYDTIIVSYFFALIFGVAMADTSSSEIGRYFHWKTVDITTFKIQIPGISGGISLPGTMASVFFSFLFSLLSIFIFPYLTPFFGRLFTFSIVGMFVDSILGSRLQAKYFWDNRIQECGVKNTLIRGIHGVNNDVVNILAILITLVLASLFELVA